MNNCEEKVYIDGNALKQYIANDGSIIGTNKGYLIEVQKVLDDIDWIINNYPLKEISSCGLDIKKYQRKLCRAKQHLKELRDNEENLSEWGKHDLGYFKGYVTALENLFDDLDIEVEE